MVLSARFGELDEAPLVRSPIVSVLWQLRFEEHPALTAPQSALRFQELLGGPERFSLSILPKIQLSVQAAAVPGVENVQNPTTSTAGSGWRLSAVEGSWQLSAESGSLAVETIRYGTWDRDFSPRLREVLDALQDVGTPVIETRLGLRYINVVVGNAVGKPPMSTPSELAELVAPWLLGPLSDTRLQDSVQATQGRTVLAFEQAKAILNHGVIATEARELGYLIDIDAFREGGRALKVDEILSHSTVLHDTALGLFQASVSPEALESMRSDSPTDGAG